ncbi:hypothetical protein TNCV_2843611 [Trichonephila clavipes]|nr:hypothetical protein TNCV_2843611 [Trichonephila clavipes]
MSEKALVDHMFVTLEPQVQDYVEVRNPQNTVQLLEVLAKFEERYSCKAIRGSRSIDNVEGRGWNERRVSNVGNNRGNWRNSEVVRRPSNSRNDYRGNYENRRQEEISGLRAGIGFKMMIEDLTIMEINFEIEVITAQEAKCQNIGVVELNIRIREFEKPWLIHVLADLEYPCILGIDFIGGSKIILDFDRKSLAIPIDLSKTKLEEKQKWESQDLFDSFQRLFPDKPGLTHVLYHEIDTGDNPPVVSRPYSYDRVKQEILDYHVNKMLKEGTIIPIQSPNASPVVLCRKNNGLPPDNPEVYRFAVDYQKLNAITKYPRYPLPLIDDLIMNIPHTEIMSTLDLRSGYFQMAMNPSDIVKTVFVTKNGTYAFRRMPFGMSRAAPNF